MRSLLRPAVLLATLLVGVVVFEYVSLTRIPDAALAVVGSGRTDVDRRGGFIMEVSLPPAIPADERARLPYALMGRARSMGAVAAVRPLGDGRLEVSVAGLAPEDAEHAQRQLVRPGRLSFQLVVANTDYGRQLVARAKSGELPGVTGEVDMWRAEEAAAMVTDYFVHGTFEALDRAYTTVGPPPDDLEIAYEMYDSQYRTWIVSRHVALSDADVAGAIVAWDPNTSKPIVLLDFTRQGAAAFAELTERNVGQRMAILVDGAVASAPVINGPIRGGRASITMGNVASDAAHREAEDLVATLNARSPLPDGLTARTVRTVTPAPGRLLLARVLCGVAASLLALLIAVPLARRGASWPASANLPAGHAGARETVRRIGVTIAIAAGLTLLTRVPRPMLELDAAMGPAGEDWTRLRSLSIASLGVMPLLVGATLVELVALLVPGWRQRRHAGYAARRPLRVAATLLALGFALLHGYGIARSHQSDLLSSPLPDTTLATLVTMLTLAAAVSLHALGAQWIGRHGIGHGLVVLYATWVLTGLFTALDELREHQLLFVAEAALAGALTAIATRTRVAMAAEPRSVRLPLAGITPLMLVGAMLVLLQPLTELGVPGVAAVAEVLRTHDNASWTGISIAVAVTAALSWCFARPAPVRALLGPTAASIAYVAALVALAATTRPITGTSFAALAAVATAAGLDLVAEVRARWRTRLVAVEEYHDVHAADRALDQHGGHLRGVHLRALLRLFGPFAPVWHLSPAEPAPPRTDA